MLGYYHLPLGLEIKHKAFLSRPENKWIKESIMKLIYINKRLHRTLTILSLALMLVMLIMACVQYAISSMSEQPSLIGLLNVDAAWKVKLKDNPFFSGEELSTEYAYVTELVDHIQIDLNLSLENNDQNVPYQVYCRADGVLRIDYDTNSNLMLLQQQYPKLFESSDTFIGPVGVVQKEFQLSLEPYTYVIDSFQSAYHLLTTSRLDLNLVASLSAEVNGKTVVKEIPLSLSIPMDTTVFQITGVPSGTAKLYRPVSADQTSFHGARIYLVLAALLLVTTLFCLFVLKPNQEESRDEGLYQALQKCKGRMVEIENEPRGQYEMPVMVSDIDQLIFLADETGQPILYYQQGNEYSFHILTQTARFLWVHKVAVGQEAQQDNGNNVQCKN
jgi:hypothetical protein